MNTAQAKQTIHIDYFLQRNGYQPVKQTEMKSWYLSPLRNEKTASFMVNRDRNTFVDWGSGERGTIIDLAMFLFSTDISGALEKLEGYRQPEKTANFFFKKQKSVSKKTLSGKIERITHPRLIDYLYSRGILPFYWESCEFLFQYTLPNTKKTKTRVPFYYWLAWKNDSGGFERRNKYMKGTMLYKNITTIPGDKSQFNIFEGFFDYLSALSFYEVNRLPGTTIVLNSIVMAHRTYKIIGKNSLLNLFLDNDAAGKEKVDSYTERFENVVNKSREIYPEYKDFNDFWIDRKKKKKKNKKTNPR